MKYAGRLFSNPGASTDAVFVLDNTVSMDYSEEGATRFEKAKEIAAKILGGISDGGAALVLLDDDSQPNPSALNYSLASVRDGIKAAGISRKGGDLNPALSRAFQLLNPAPELNKEIFFLTDMQRAVMEGPGSVRISDNMKERTRLNIINFGSYDFINAAVTGVNVFPGVSVRGQKFEVRAVLSNFSFADRSVSAALYINGVKKTSRIAQVAGNSSASVSFMEESPEPGVHSGFVEIEPDSLAADDRRDFVIEVRQKLDVIFALNDLSDASLRQAVFLAAALNPQAGKISSPFSVQFISASQLEGADLSNCASVVLMDVRRMADPDLQRLSSFVKDGGSAIFFLGDSIDKAYYNNELGASGASFFPAEVGDLIDVSKGKGFSSISLVDWRHPIFAAFQAPGQGDLGSAHFFKFWSLRASADSGTGILASFDNSYPFLLEKSFGRGKVLAFAGLPSVGWNDFYVKPVFVAFVHEIMRYLLPRQGLGSEDNPDPAESDLTPVSKDKVNSYFKGLSPAILDAKDPRLLEEIALRRQGISLRVTLAWLLLGLLVAESILSNWLVSRSSQES